MKLTQYMLLLFSFTVLFACNKSDELDEIAFENEVIEGEYSKSIERSYANNFEANLIDQSEKYYPSREEVQSMLWPGTTIVDSAYWHDGTVDIIGIPILVTIDAINYYSNLIDELNTNNETSYLIRASFNYSAGVTFYENYVSPSVDAMGNSVKPEEFSSVYVVYLQLKWSNYCGSLCGLWVEKERYVVFDKSGKLLKVFLDGHVPVLVS